MATTDTDALMMRLWQNMPPSAQERVKSLPIVGSLLRARDRALAEAAELRRQIEASEGPWVPAGHFYSPLPDLKDIRARRETIFERAPREVPGVDLNDEAQLALLRSFKPLYDEQPFPARPTPGTRYCFENDFFSYADGLVLYCMLRHLRPRRYLEIGSGHSSALAIDVNERFLGGAMAVTLIEPYLDRLRSLLLADDEARIEIIGAPLQDVPLSRFAALEAGDVLFIDSTHVSKVGSDVNRIFFEILPLLASGVYVHFHDIFYPFEYMEEWVMAGRAWTEAYLLRAFLQYNRAFRIMFFNDYMGVMHGRELGEVMPLCLKNTGGSLWLRKE